MTKLSNLKILGLIAIFGLSLGLFFQIKAETLDSGNYKILDSTIDSGGGVSTGNSAYDILFSTAQTGADPRLLSANYRIKSGFPNSFQASVPIITCFETNTNSGTTDCLLLPNANGMIGECGSPGCYNRAKLEISDENNPIDALYLVAISPDSWTTTLYLQSDHTIGSTFSINNFLTQCELEGRDADDPACDDSGDSNWNVGLQRYNILGLKPDTTYQVKVTAIHGDFTQTEYSPIESATTELPTIALDLDVSATDTETSSPHTVAFGALQENAPKTADKRIWADVTTNSINGVNVYVNNLGNGLYNSPDQIPSESEDLASQDGDGGYGLKIETTYTTETLLGPLQDGANYVTAGANQVGNLTLATQVIFFTDTTGGNRGPVNNGRGQIYVKARSYSSLKVGTYTDTITFTALANW